MTDSTSEARAFLIALGGIVRRDLAPNETAMAVARRAVALGYSAKAAVRLLETSGHNLTKARTGGMVLDLLKEELAREQDRREKVAGEREEMRARQAQRASGKREIAAQTTADQVRRLIAAGYAPDDASGMTPSQRAAAIEVLTAIESSPLAAGATTT